MSPFPSWCRFISINMCSVYWSCLNNLLQSGTVPQSFSLSQALKSLRVTGLSFSGVWVYLMLPHDQTKAMHSWQEYNTNDAVFSMHHIQGPLGQPIPPFCSPGQGSVYQVSRLTIHHVSTVFDYNLVGSCSNTVSIHWSLWNLHPQNLASIDNPSVSTTTTMVAKWWISTTSIIPFTFLSWHSTVRKRFPFSPTHLSIYLYIHWPIHSFIYNMDSYFMQ